MAKRQQNAYTTYTTHVSATPQSAPIPGTAQVPNSAGGYSFAVDKWTRLQRFLILGTEGGSYYASERALTRDNAENVAACIAEDGPRAVSLIVGISQAGRAVKNTPAIFALALAAAAADTTTRQVALASLREVCRTGTHLFTFAEMVSGLRGWGRALRRAVGAWYTEQPPEQVAYQLTKYRQRDGWTHLDLIRLGHPKPATPTQDALLKWVANDDTPPWAGGEAPPADAALRKVWAFEQARRATTAAQIVRLIADHDLVREAIPPGFLNDPQVWAALLVKMPLTAMIRNLGVMSKVGLLAPMSDAERVVTERLRDAERLRRARVHPLAVLVAQTTYQRGAGFRGSGTWTPAPGVVAALDDAFTLAFGAVQPANKRTLLALDVSGSMAWGNIAGLPFLSPRVASAAMAMVTARTEPQYHFTAFSHELVPVSINARTALPDVVGTLSRIEMGGTDCALPMVYARQAGLAVDTFIVYTDNETWYGNVHPVQALRKYRDASGIPARLIVVAMTANRFSIADPSDAGMLDVVGFDTAAPNLMNAFARGEV